MSKCFQRLTVTRVKGYGIAVAVLLLIINRRIVATYDATCQSIDVVFATAAGQRIQFVLTAQ
jgi:hypothetical protein